MPFSESWLIITMFQIPFYYLLWNNKSANFENKIVFDNNISLHVQVDTIQIKKTYDANKNNRINW